MTHKNPPTPSGESVPAPAKEQQFPPRRWIMEFPGWLTVHEAPVSSDGYKAKEYLSLAEHQAALAAKDARIAELEKALETISNATLLVRARELADIARAALKGKP